MTTDFDKLAASEKIEDKLKAAQDPECPAEALDKIVMDGSVPWGTEMGNTLANAIASNSNCPAGHLATIYENPTDDGQRLLVLQNPNCSRDLINKVVEGDDTKRKQAVLKNPALSADIVLGCAKSESIGSELITAIAERSDLDDITREIVDLKIKFAKLGEQHKEESGYAWLEESLLSITDWGRDVFDAIYRDDEEHIRSAVAKNPSLPEKMLSELIEDSQSSVKLSALANPSCTKTILKKASEDTENYSSSRVRKAVALNTKTPKAVLNKLLKDEYRWVREAAASHPDIETQAITKLITTADRYILKGLAVNPNCDKTVQVKINNMLGDEEKYPVEYDTYEIKTDSAAPERMVESFSLKEFLEFSYLNTDGLNEWFTDYRYDAEIPQGEQFWGDNPIINKEIEFPDGSIERSDIPIIGKTFEEKTSEIIKSMSDGEILIEGEMEWTDGYWKSFFTTLEKELELEAIDAEMECGVITGYGYNGNEDGYFEEGDDWSLSDGYISIEVSVFWNGKIHSVDIDELCENIDNDGLDSGNEDDVRKYIEKIYIV